MKRLLPVALILAVLLAVPWILGAFRPGPAPPTSSSGPWTVTTTTTLAADLVRRLGGDRVRVQSLMGPGVDPHQYRAREGDLGRLLDSRLVVYHGLHLEGRMGRVLQSLPRLGIPVLALGEILPEERILRPGESPDPHVWMDVGLWAETVPAVVEALTRIDPAGAEEFRERGHETRRRLQELDQWIRSEVQSIPSEQRMLVTAHDAFGYFGRAYGLEVRGVQGFSTVTEAGARDIARLADEIARRRVPALFIETSVSPRLVEAVMRSVAARGHEVRLGGSLLSDSLGSPNTPGGTYEGMMRSNVRTIVAGLRPPATSAPANGTLSAESNEGP